MSDITFIVANKRANSGIENGVVGSKYFTDCTININHSFVNDVTEHAVELGESFSDHTQVKNNRFTLSGVFSQIPLVQYAGDQLPYRERLASAYRFLLSLRNDKTPFTLISKYGQYANCQVETLEIPTDAENSNSLYFNMTIVQVRPASTSLVNIVKLDNIAQFKKDDAANNSDNGKKQPMYLPSLGGR